MVHLSRIGRQPPNIGIFNFIHNIFNEIDFCYNDFKHKGGGGFDLGGGGMKKVLFSRIV